MSQVGIGWDLFEIEMSQVGIGFGFELFVFVLFEIVMR